MKYCSYRAGIIIEINNSEINTQGVTFITIATDPQNIYTATTLVCSSQTLVMDVNYREITLNQLKIGDYVFVYHNNAMTMSIPPQTQTFIIEVKKDLLV